MVRQLSIALCLVMGVAGWANAQDEPLPSRASLRLGSTRWTADSYIVKLAFSQNGAYLYSSSTGVQKWDVRTGERIASWSSYYGDMLDVSADGQWMLLGSTDRQLRLVELATGKVVRSLQRAPASLAAFSPDGKTVVCALEDEKTLVLRDRETGAERGRLEGADVRLRVVAYSPDGKYIAASENTQTLWDGTVDILIWEAATTKPYTRIHSRNQGMTQGLAFSSDNRQLIVGSVQRVRVFDIESGRSLYVLGHQKRGQIAVEPKGNWFVTGGEGVLWDLNTDKRLRQLLPRHESIGAIAISRDGKTIATANSSIHHQSIDLWDAATGRKKTPVLRHRAEVEEVAWSPDGKTIATRAPRDGTIMLWDATTGQPRRALDWGAAPFFVHGDFGFRDKGTVLLAGGRRWATATGKEIDDVLDVTDRKERQGNTVTDRRDTQFVSVSPDGRFAVDLDMRRRVRVWDVRKDWITIRVEPLAKVHPTGPIRYTFTPDSKTVVVAHQYEPTMRVPSLRLYDLETRAVRASYRPELFHIYHLECTPDGERLIVSGTNGVEVRKLTTGELLHRYAKDPRQEPRSHAVAVSPDSRVIAFESERGEITLMEVATGKTIDAWPAASAPLRALAFSPDGRRLLTGSRDATAMVWNVAPRPDSAALLKSKNDQQLWDAMATDPAPAFAVASALVADPPRARAMLEKRLTSVPLIEEKQIAQWIKNLGSETFAKRDEAYKQLRLRGIAVASHLRATLKETLPLEMKLRVENLLLAAEATGPSPEQLRDERALQVLEMLGDAESRRILTAISRGAAGSPRTTAAQAALDRLRERGP